jgi:glutaredoxin
LEHREEAAFAPEVEASAVEPGHGPAVPTPVVPPTAAAGSELANAPARVVVYTTSWCPACRKAKAWLRENRVPFEERDIEANRSYAAELRARNPRMSIPTIDVNGDVSVGFSSSWIVAVLKKHGGVAAL